VGQFCKLCHSERARSATRGISPFALNDVILLFLGGVLRSRLVAQDDKW
jgi:hypothetical protein